MTALDQSKPPDRDVAAEILHWRHGLAYQFAKSFDAATGTKRRARNFVLGNASLISGRLSCRPITSRRARRARQDLRGLARIRGETSLFRGLPLADCGSIRGGQSGQEDVPACERIRPQHERWPSSIRFRRRPRARRNTRLAAIGIYRAMGAARGQGSKGGCGSTGCKGSKARTSPASGQDGSRAIINIADKA